MLTDPLTSKVSQLLFVQHKTSWESFSGRWLTAMHIVFRNQACSDKPAVLHSWKTRLYLHRNKGNTGHSRKVTTHGTRKSVHRWTWSVRMPVCTATPLSYTHSWKLRQLTDMRCLLHVQAKHTTPTSTTVHKSQTTLQPGLHPRMTKHYRGFVAVCKIKFF